MFLQSPLTTLLATFLLVLVILPSLATAQFQFFNNLFEGQQQQPQEKQNVGSDSGWYQQVVENGMYGVLASASQPAEASMTATLISYPPATLLLVYRIADTYSLGSTLHALPLSQHLSLRPFPAPLSLRISRSGGQSRIGGWDCHMC